MQSLVPYVLILGVCACSRVAPDLGPPVVEAAALGELTRLRELLAQGVPPDSRDPRGFTPLILAARQGQLEALSLLVGAGADPDLAGGRNGWTPLLHAVHKNQLQAVETLLRLGADVTGAGTSGMSPLIMAAGYGQNPTVELLLQHGADVWRSTHHGETALHAAVTGVFDIDGFTLGACQPVTVQLLLQHEPTLRRQADMLGSLTRFYVRRHCPAVAALLWEARKH